MYSKRGGEASWKRLAQVLDMSKDDLVIYIEKN